MCNLKDLLSSIISPSYHRLQMDSEVKSSASLSTWLPTCVSANQHIYFIIYLSNLYNRPHDFPPYFSTHSFLRKKLAIAASTLPHRRNHGNIPRPQGSGQSSHPFSLIQPSYLTLGYHWHKRECFTNMRLGFYLSSLKNQFINIFSSQRSIYQSKPRSIIIHHDSNLPP